MDSATTSSPSPCIVTTIAGKIHLSNDTMQPLVIKNHSHVAQVCTDNTSTDSSLPSAEPSLPTAVAKSANQTTLHSSTANLDPANLLPPVIRSSFQDLYREFDTVFDSEFPGYNGAAGPLETVVNVGPTLPPQGKGHLPQCPRNKLVELQDKFDTLEKAGVFVHPEDHSRSIVAEYLNPSFLIKKASGSYHLVTAFAEVGRYTKPQPSLMPNVDSTLRHITRWKYLIQSYLTNALYQIPLAKSSMKFCGVVTPFKGVRVYAQSAMACQALKPHWKS